MKKKLEDIIKQCAICPKRYLAKAAKGQDRQERSKYCSQKCYAAQQRISTLKMFQMRSRKQQEHANQD